MPNQNDSKEQIRQQMLARNDPTAAEPVHKPQVARKPYQLLMIPVLREYITHEFAPERPLPFAYDPERVIDDFGAYVMKNVPTSKNCRLDSSDRVIDMLDCVPLC